MAFRPPHPHSNVPVLSSHRTDVEVQSIDTQCQLHFCGLRHPVAAIHRLWSVSLKWRHLTKAGMWIGATSKDSCITTSLGCYSYMMQLSLLSKCLVLEKNQGQLLKLNRTHFWGVKSIQQLNTVKLPGCLGQKNTSISRFDLAVCWRVSVHLRVWKRPMQDERMGTRLVRSCILPPWLTRAIIKPGGCHLCGARMLVFIYADYSALLSAIYCGRHCVEKVNRLWPMWHFQPLFEQNLLLLCIAEEDCFIFFTKQR